MPEPAPIGRNASAQDVGAFARQLFANSLAAASIEHAFDRHVHCEHRVLRIGDDLYELGQYERVFAIAIGKAGHTMAEALASRLGAGTLEGIVVAPVEVSPQLPGFRYFRGGHPLPNEESVGAGQAVLRELHAQTERSLVIYMISGGASSLCEKPITPEIALADLVATYRVLVHSGAPIAQINAIRKHLSALKGGRMAQAAGPARQVAILVSDVPEGKLDSLASGPTMPDSTSVEDCYAVAEKYGMVEDFPAPVRQMFELRQLQETPKPGDAESANTRNCLISSNETALNAAADMARATGFEVLIDNSCDDWDYASAAGYLLGKLRELRQSAPRACVVSGGEVTVKVVNGGAGGRNQQFALYCAAKIAGENVLVLSAGTDGIDGNSPAAGAVSDGSTMERALAHGLDPAEALEKFNAYPLFEKLNDAIMTGPTGNNVRDLRVLLAW
jgi:glycerate 2-kinase